jgi:hypothetical protein
MTGGKAFLIAVALVAGCAVASAQDEVGAGKVEVGGFPGGGIYFVSGNDNNEVNFNDFVYGGGATWYLNPAVGVEAEMLGGIGIAQDVNYHNKVVFHNQVPNLLGASGNVVIFPGGSRRRVAGYVTAGAGILTLLSRDQTKQFGMTESETYFSYNVGGGAKFFRGGDARNWGWRADYRLVIVPSKGDVTINPLDASAGASFFAQSKTRLGHRISFGMFYTLKR